MLTCHWFTPADLASPAMTKITSNSMLAAILTKNRHIHTRCHVSWQGKWH